MTFRYHFCFQARHLHDSFPQVKKPLKKKKGVTQNKKGWKPSDIPDNEEEGTKQDAEENQIYKTLIISIRWIGIGRNHKRKLTVVSWPYNHMGLNVQKELMNQKDQTQIMNSPKWTRG